jgi:Flp pilus assembly protein protease CpaA
MDAAQLLLFAGVGGTLAVGAAWDLRTRRIPNLLTGGSALLGLAFNLALHQQQGALHSLEGWVAGVLLLSLPFLLGGMGGGDLKLLGAVGAWAGAVVAFNTLFFGSLIASVMALGLLIVRRQLLATLSPVLSWLGGGLVLALALISPRAWALVPTASSFGRPASEPVRPRLAVPYGPALALGGLLALFLR